MRRTSASGVLYLVFPCRHGIRRPGHLIPTKKKTTTSYSSQGKGKAGIFKRTGNAPVKEMKGCGGTWGRNIENFKHRGLPQPKCTPHPTRTGHLRPCQPHSEVQDVARTGSHGGFAPVCTAGYLQGTVVGVQSQQVLVCARIWPEGSSPGPKSTQKVGPALCVLRGTKDEPFLPSMRL